MAMAGGACSAYVCQVRDNRLLVEATTTLRSLCADVTEALGQLEQAR